MRLKVTIHITREYDVDPNWLLYCGTLPDFETVKKHAIGGAEQAFDLGSDALTPECSYTIDVEDVTPHG